ncbi:MULTISPECIES: hypothetical protein [Ulvibacterium]|uniref:Uncharacterized protein n=1 Tax=Ulvibacterium marinum TaxID=2419782 RepID=A0A3B0BU19_9FLAO|nr:hypothetical protein [Ulvibacterium marinum]RKN76813.1 hypothetical protein D7Z94_23820 [Ulvibacterium marinum]
MNYLDKIDKIIIKVNSVSSEKANELIEIKKSSFTGTELLMSFTYELSLITKKDEELDELVGSDLTELISYCQKIGLSIKDVR